MRHFFKHYPLEHPLKFSPLAMLTLLTFKSRQLLVVRINKVVMRCYMRLPTVSLAEKLRSNFNCTRSNKIVNYKIVDQYPLSTKRYFSHINAKNRMRIHLFFSDFYHCNVTCNVLEIEKNTKLSLEICIAGV